MELGPEQLSEFVITPPDPNADLVECDGEEYLLPTETHLQKFNRTFEPKSEEAERIRDVLQLQDAWSPIVVRIGSLAPTGPADAYGELIAQLIKPYLMFGSARHLPTQTTETAEPRIEKSEREDWTTSRPIPTSECVERETATEKTWPADVPIARHSLILRRLRIFHHDREQPPPEVSDLRCCSYPLELCYEINWNGESARTREFPRDNTREEDRWFKRVITWSQGLPGMGRRSGRPAIYTERHRMVLAVVAKYSNWKTDRDVLEQVLNELDELKISTPLNWQNKAGLDAYTWMQALDRDKGKTLVVKALEASLSYVRKHS